MRRSSRARLTASRSVGATPGTMPDASQSWSAWTASFTRGSSAGRLLGVVRPNGIRRARPFGSDRTELPGKYEAPLASSGVTA